MVRELEAQGFTGKALEDEMLRIMGMDELDRGEVRAIIAHEHGSPSDEHLTFVETQA